PSVTTTAPTGTSPSSKACSASFSARRNQRRSGSNREASAMGKRKVKKASYAVFPFLLLTFPFPHERHRHAAGAAAAARELVARQLDGDAGAVLDLVVAVEVEEALGVGDVEAVLAEGVERAAVPLVADDEAGADGEEVGAVGPLLALLRQGVGAAAGDERVGAPGHLGQRHLQAREHAHAEAVRPVARLEVEHVVAGLLDD